MKSKTYKFLLPPGIGDQHWCIQFAYPFAKIRNSKIDWKVQDHNPKRTKEFLNLIDITNSVEYIKNDYPEWFDYHKPFEEQVIEDKVNPIIVNNWLDQKGIRVERCYKKSPSVTEYPIIIPTKYINQVKELKEKLNNNYIVFYTSSKRNNDRLNSYRYANIAESIIDKTTPILIGKEWDNDMLYEITGDLDNRGYKRDKDYYYFLDYPIAFILELIKQSKMLFGYQSGLHIMADVFNTPFYMLYFPHLKAMVGKWIKKKNKQQSVETFFNSFDINLFNDYLKKLLNKKEENKIIPNIRVERQNKMNKECNLKEFFKGFNFPIYYKSSPHIYSDNYYNLMFDFASEISSNGNQDKKNILILGGLFGCSTKSIAEGIGKEKINRIRIIDNESEYKSNNILLSNTDIGLKDIPILLFPRTWQEGIEQKEIKEEKFDLILIDTDISYENVKTQIEWSYSRLNENGGIIVDDLVHENVQKAVQDFGKNTKDCKITYKLQPESYTGMAFIKKNIQEKFDINDEKHKIANPVKPKQIRKPRKKRTIKPKVEKEKKIDK